MSIDKDEQDAPEHLEPQAPPAGPVPRGEPEFRPYHHPSAGWGAAKSVTSDNDRYRGVKNLRTLVFMNRADMRERRIADLGQVDITSTAKDGSQRHLTGYLAVPYDIPRGCAAGYMPEMNVLCALGDYSTQSDQPIMKHVKVTIGPAA